MNALGHKGQRVFFGLVFAACITLAFVLFLYYSVPSTSNATGEKSREAAPLPPAMPAKAEALVEKEAPYIFGTVKDKSGDPVVGGEVKVSRRVSEDAGSDFTVKSSKNGAYSISGLRLGDRYEIIISAPGFLRFSSGEFLFDKSPKETHFVLLKAESKSESMYEQKARVPADELEMILSGARAAIEKIQSGRIVYKSMTMSWKGIAKESISRSVKSQADFLRTRGRTEEEIRININQLRAELEEQLKADGYWTSNWEGEYIFEGENSYCFTAAAEDPRMTFSGYVYQNRTTILTTSLEKGRVRAEIRKGTEMPMVNLHSPFVTLKQAITMLQDRNNWRTTRILEDNGETVYEFTGSLPSGGDGSVRILPGKGYALRDYDYGTPQSGRKIAYDDIKWDSDAGAYYPSKITQITRMDGRVTWKQSIELLQVELNKDYDEGLFKVSFDQGTNITDYRFNPPKYFKYNYPEVSEEYLKELDERVKALKE